jgi:hypothetical protein
MKSRELLLIALALDLLAGPLKASLVTISMESGGYQLFSDAAKTQLLTAGNLSINGDGAVLQLGYYEGATTSNNFGNGTFIPIAGSGSNNSNVLAATLTIGDRVINGGTSGEFWLGTIDFTVGDSPNFTQTTPVAGTPLSLRFFNNTTIESSTFYNAVSNDYWVWGTPAIAPANPLVYISLADGDSPSPYPMEWLGGGSSAFYTSISLAPVPEVSTFGLLSGLALLVIAGYQHRRRLFAAAAGFLR